MFPIPKLQKPYPLPRPQGQPPIRNRYRDTRSDERRLDMRLHPIR